MFFGETAVSQKVKEDTGRVRHGGAALGGVSRSGHGVLRETGAQGLKLFPVFRWCQPVAGSAEEKKRHIEAAEIIFGKLRVEAAVFYGRAGESPPVAAVGGHVLFLYGLHETRKSLFRVDFGGKALHET